MNSIIAFEKTKSIANKILFIIIYLFMFDFVDSLNTSRENEYESLLFKSTTKLFLPSAESEIQNDIDKNNSNTTMKDEYPVEYYAYPIIFLIGSCCNILTFIVMRRKKMRHQSTYFYMAVLAIADEMVLINGCLNFWIYLYTGKNITIMSAISCKIACIGLYATLHFSVWMVVTMTVERFIAVGLPLQASRLCTVKRAKTATCCLALFILSINIHFVFTHSLLVRSNDTEPGCQSISENYDFFMEKIWPWIDASIYSFIPLSLLIIFNILIVHNLIKASKNIEKINNKTENNSPNQQLAKKAAKKADKNSKKRQNSEADLHDYHERQKENRFYNFFLFRLIFMPRFKQNTSHTNDSSERKIKFKFVKSNNNINDHNNQNLSASKYNQNTLVSTTSSPSTKNSKYSTSNINVSSGTHGGNSASSANRRLTVMLLVVSMTFFITSMPIVTLQTIEQANLIQKSRTLSIIRGIFLVLQYMNHSINFFLYAVTGKTFRREFFALFEPCKKRLGLENKKKGCQNNLNKKNNVYINNNNINRIRATNQKKNNLDNNSSNIKNNSIKLNQTNTGSSTNVTINTNTNTSRYSNNLDEKSLTPPPPEKNVNITADLINNDQLNEPLLKNKDDDLFNLTKSNPNKYKNDRFDFISNESPLLKKANIANVINFNYSGSDIYFVQSDDETFKEKINRKESIF